MKRVAPASVCYVMNDVLKDVFTLRHGRQGALPRIRASIRREDRHHEQLSRRLDHRLLAARAIAGLDRLRRRPQHTSGGRRCLPADLDAPHEPHRWPDRGRRLETPRGCDRAGDRPALRHARHRLLPDHAQRKNTSSERSRAPSVRSTPEAATPAPTRRIRKRRSPTAPNPPPPTPSRRSARPKSGSGGRKKRPACADCCDAFSAATEESVAQAWSIFDAS